MKRLFFVRQQYSSQLRVLEDLLRYLGGSGRSYYSRSTERSLALTRPQRILLIKGRFPSRSLCGTSPTGTGAGLCVGDRDRSLVEASEAAVEDCNDLTVIPEFITVKEGESLLQEIQKTLKGKRYLYNHWDGAIEGYRETEKTRWGEVVQPLIHRLQKTAEKAGGEGVRTLDEVHVLDLAEDGFIKPHIDSVKFCGDVIAGLSLMSQCVMVFTHQEESNRWIRALLPPLSLYIMRGRVRYEYTHAIPPIGEDSKFKGQTVTKERRVSVISRTFPSPQL